MRSETLGAAPPISRRSFATAAFTLGATVAAAARARADAPPPEATGVVRALDDLAAWAVAQKAQLSALAVEIGSGRELAASSPGALLNPASNQKILTAATALHALGPEHRFTTALFGRISGETLSELVLRSDGDPDLSTRDVDELVRRVLLRGVRSISGDVLVDQSAFDSVWEPPAYEQRPNDWAAYRAPVSAVAVARNALTVHVLADPQGKAARTWIEPPGIAETRGTVKTGRAGGAQAVGLTVHAAGSNLVVELGGSVPSGRGELSFTRRLGEPALAPARVLRALLLARGVAVPGGVGQGRAKPGDALVVHRSAPLGQIIHSLGKQSDNFTAEMLLKALGRKRTGAAGSSAEGAAAVEDYLRTLGLLEPGVRVGNGSGLFDTNRVSANALARVLSSAYLDPRVGADLVASLAIGGVDGTLSQRFQKLAAQRGVRAKTGTLANVVALSGYVLHSAPRAPVAFSILVNGAAGRIGEARRLMDAVVEAIAR